jgi:hypothetical protein
MLGSGSVRLCAPVVRRGARGAFFEDGGHSLIEHRRGPGGIIRSG